MNDKKLFYLLGSALSSSMSLWSSAALGRWSLVRRGPSTSDSKRFLGYSISLYEESVSTLSPRRSGPGNYRLLKETPAEFVGYVYFDSCTGDSGGPMWLDIKHRVRKKSHLRKIKKKFSPFKLYYRPPMILMTIGLLSWESFLGGPGYAGSLTR